MTEEVPTETVSLKFEDSSTHQQIIFDTTEQSALGDLITHTYELVEHDDVEETYEIHTIPNTEEGNIIINFVSDGADPNIDLTQETTGVIVAGEKNSEEILGAIETIATDEIVNNEDNTNNTVRPLGIQEPVKCVLCKDTFANFSIFRDHLFNFHISGRLFKCKLCEKQFDFLSELKKHDTVHTGIKPFTCEYCSKGFLKKNVYEGHLLLHKVDAGLPFQCTYCDRKFRLKEHSSTHIWRHEDENSIKLECNGCNLNFYSDLALSNHRNRGDCVESLRELTYSCEICCSTFHKRIEYINHFKTVHPEGYFLKLADGYVCIKCGEICNDNIIKNKHIKAHKSKDTFRYQCRFCDKILKGKGGFALHMKMHNQTSSRSKGNKKIKSTNLSGGTETEETLADSGVVERKCYDMEINIDYQCDGCPLKAHMTKLSIENHKKCHLTGPPFTCERCQQVFMNREDWVYHLQQCFTGHHEGEIPCPACLSELDTLRGLKIHMRMMHKEHLDYQMQVDKVHYLKCNICQKDFLTRASLAFHKRRHRIRDVEPKAKDYQCPFCPSKFASTITLMVHKRSHTGEKPFACKYCSKPFKDRTSLRNHSIVHTKLYRHYCQTCNKGFVTPYKMKMHIERTHLRGIKPPKPKTPRIKVPVEEFNVDM